MKCFVLTKRKLAAAALILILCGTGIVVAALFGSCGDREEVRKAAAAAERKIPIYSVETKEKKIAISFDAAWGNEQTEDLIRILDTYGVKTTFFVVGEWRKNTPNR